MQDQWQEDQPFQSLPLQVPHEVGAVQEVTKWLSLEKLHDLPAWTHAHTYTVTHCTDTPTPTQSHTAQTHPHPHSHTQFPTVEWVTQNRCNVKLPIPGTMSGAFKPHSPHSPHTHHCEAGEHHRYRKHTSAACHKGLFTHPHTKQCRKGYPTAPAPPCIWPHTYKQRKCGQFE